MLEPVDTVRVPETQMPSTTSPPPALETPRLEDQKEKSGSIADLIGIFADEPLWDEVMAEIREIRERQNATEAREPSK